ncbi:hypothetical protein NDU88_007559 [Pleurodeles waltl]|uniref:Uncharacterized protein n=1 Tax=Pleurodeles waltl TaxID=8319 RepID=A0AAV7RQM5_PLEWA|nr:hypothetical protein NDU88_007559 [Pleurodeles waltl]
MVMAGRALPRGLRGEARLTTLLPVRAALRGDIAEEAHMGQRVRRLPARLGRSSEASAVCGWRKVGANGCDAPGKTYPVVRGQFIAIAARQNAQCHDKRQQLEGDIWALEETHRQSGSLAVTRQLTIKRKELRALDEDKAEYALLRTKQKFCTGGNTAGRLLAHRLRTQATERRVAELRLPDGTLTCQ